MSDVNPYLEDEGAAPVPAAAGGNPYLDETPEDNPYLETGVLERAGNAVVAFPQGMVTSVGESVSGAARTLDTIKEGSLLTGQMTGTARPTPRQQRRAFVQGMEDPRYMTALMEAGDDPAAQQKAEWLFGPKAKLDAIRAPIEASRSSTAEESKAQQARLAEDPLYNFGKGIVEAGREVYSTNPYLDTLPESKLTRSLGSTLPTVALGAVPVIGTTAGVTQYALSQSESMAQEAMDAGRPDLALQSATAGLFIGALSEGVIGASARLRTLLKNPTSIAALDGWAKANPVKATMLIGGIREAAQEGTEQTLQNVTASDLVGYDPNRPWHWQVLESMVLGGLGGAIFGGAAGGVQRLANRPKPGSEEEAAALAEFNSALDALQAEPPPEPPQRIDTLQAPAPALEGPEGEVIPLPPAEVQTPGPVQMLPAFEPEMLTPEQKMAREAAAAMAELRALKAQRASAQESGVRSQESEAPTPISQLPSPDVERPAVTIEPPTAPAVETTNPTSTSSALVEAAPEPVQQQKPAKETKRRFTLGPREDGIPDVLDAIAELGGIRAPKGSTGGEYDGYAAAFNQGGPQSVLRGGSQAPDLLLRALQADFGFKYESVDQMYDAVRRAGNARNALTAQLKAERTVRPEMVERVQSLYDSAVAGQPVTSAELAELEGSLTQKELKTLKAPLIKLRTLADVAPAESTADELSPIEAAKLDVRAAWADMQTLGIMPDPKRDAEKAFALYQALFKLAKVYAKQGIRTAEAFAEKMGLKLNGVVRAAWDDAAAGKAKARALDLEPAAVSEMVEEARERKFSRRFDDDDRIAPEIRAATGNATYQAIPNEITVTQALGIIQDQGLDAAIAQLKDERNRNISDRERVALGQAIISKLNHEYAQTKSEAALDKAVDIAEWLTEYGTRLGQGVQAFAIWSRLTPDGLVRAYVKAVRDHNQQNPKAPATADPATKRKVHALATEALKKPVGFQRDEAMVDVLAHIARAQGISKMDVATALWYANILSGWTTQVRNAAGNLSHLLAESFAHAAARPQHLPAILAGLYNGALRGTLDAAPILRTGKVTGTRVGKLDAPPVLELIKFKGVAYPLNAWKYVFRVMAATDMVAFRSAEEMRARFTARELVRTEKLSGQALARRLAELLHNTPALKARAQEQATQEGLTGNNRRRRVAEIIEQNRPADLVQSAADYGRYATYNQDPNGMLGAIAQGINSISRRFPPMRLVVPFTRVVANVTNNALNFTPWGYRRLFPSAFMDENWMKEDAVPLDYQLQAARATLGTLALVSLYALAVQHADDDDPSLMLTANGPQDPDARRQLRETGWEPYTVKIGDRYWSYKETPLHLVMATLGSLLDAQRYKKLDEADAMTRYTYALYQIATAPLNQSFLRSLSEFFDGLSDDRVPRTGANFSGLSRTASSMLVPNLAKQIDKLFDPTIYDAGTVQGALLRDIPIARRGMEPALNILGEPIKADQNPFYSLERPDELWNLIGRRQLWIPTPSRTMMIGDRPISPEEYRELIASSGPAIRRRLEILTPFLSAVPRELAQDRVESITREERAAARRRLGLAR